MRRGGTAGDSELTMVLNRVCLRYWEGGRTMDRRVGSVKKLRNGILIVGSRLPGFLGTKKFLELSISHTKKTTLEKNIEDTTVFEDFHKESLEVT